ncbi:uncharacterized protein CMC5_045860 [Chondromyces crocatus]|uniref:Uncharacterized protein n=1 Tax=Chondromyces crocatus TaxID=52 RepID=A0A0K1EIL3_CHOCO|nr:uncharacterized protein CMC5_045860 [Chondromyces crocatus]
MLSQERRAGPFVHRGRSPPLTEPLLPGLATLAGSDQRRRTDTPARRHAVKDFEPKTHPRHDATARCEEGSSWHGACTARPRACSSSAQTVEGPAVLGKVNHERQKRGRSCRTAQTNQTVACTPRGASLFQTRPETRRRRRTRAFQTETREICEAKVAKRSTVPESQKRISARLARGSYDAPGVRRPRTVVSPKVLDRDSGGQGLALAMESREVGAPGAVDSWSRSGCCYRARP